MGGWPLTKNVCRVICLFEEYFIISLQKRRITGLTFFVSGHPPTCHNFSKQVSILAMSVDGHWNAKCGSCLMSLLRNNQEILTYDTMGVCAGPQF